MNNTVIKVQQKSQTFTSAAKRQHFDIALLSSLACHNTAGLVLAATTQQFIHIFTWAAIVSISRTSTFWTVTHTGLYVAWRKPSGYDTNSLLSTAAEELELNCHTAGTGSSGTFLAEWRLLPSVTLLTGSHLRVHRNPAEDGRLRSQR